MKHPEDKDLLILVLEAGMKHQKEGITFDELRAFVESNGHPLPNKSDIDFLSRLYYDVFFKDNKRVNAQDKRFLNEEGYFKYLNYKALVEARQSSAKSAYMAILAILIAAASLLLNFLPCIKK